METGQRRGHCTRKAWTEGPLPRRRTAALSEYTWWQSPAIGIGFQLFLPCPSRCRVQAAPNAASEGTEMGIDNKPKLVPQ